MSLPLSRYRVLDLTRVRAGPTAVRQFADWGADVIMVEPRAGGDLGSGRDSSDFQNLNRNKRSIALDLKNEADKAVFMRLVETADLLVENFRPDVKFRLGIDYETVARINPALVYVSISGFGEDGPYRMRPGLDQIVQGMAGLMSITGLPGQGPVRAGVAICDSAAGLYAAIGALTALVERQTTGKGRWVRTSLLQAMIAMLDFQAARWLVDGEVPPQQGNDHPTACPMGLFPAADGVFNLAATGDPMFKALCEVMGLEKLIGDERFTRTTRAKNRTELNAIISGVTSTKPVAFWIDALNAAGVPCGPVNTIDQTFADPQVQSLGIVAPVEHSRLGTLNLVGQPINIAGLPFSIRKAAPDLGEDSETILATLR